MNELTVQSCQLYTSYKPRPVIGQMNSRDSILPITHRGLYEVLSLHIERGSPNQATARTLKLYL